jgi:hypothetical protein
MNPFGDVKITGFSHVEDYIEFQVQVNGKKTTVCLKMDQARVLAGQIINSISNDFGEWHRNKNFLPIKEEIAQFHLRPPKGLLEEMQSISKKNSKDKKISLNEMIISAMKVFVVLAKRRIG